jgi:hypothetical protein
MQTGHEPVGFSRFSLTPLPERIEVVESSTKVVSNALHRFERVAKSTNIVVLLVCVCVRVCVC